MIRFVEYDSRLWRLSDLARAYRIPRSTLSDRMERFGATATGIRRALATGIMTREQAGRRGAARSPWRYPRKNA